jgi:hypothetical protein
VLKLREGAWVAAEAYETEQLLHGYLAAVDESVRAFVLEGEGVAAERAAAAAAALRRPLWRSAGRGRIVVCVGSAVDAAAAIRRRYGGGRDLERATRVLASLAPTPARTFLLDDGGADAALYRAAAAALGAQSLSGDASQLELCEQLAAGAWDALKRPRP